MSYKNIDSGVTPHASSSYRRTNGLHDPRFHIRLQSDFVQEAPVYEGIKQVIADMTETDTALIFRTFGNTARVYKNKVATKVLEIEKAGRDFSQIHPLVSGK